MRIYRKKRNRLWFFVLSLFLLITSVSVFILYKTRIHPVISQVATARAQSVAVSTINDAVNHSIVSKSVKYGELAILQKDAEGRITAVMANVSEISRLKAEIALSVQEEMEKIDEMVMRIPLGTLLANGFFSGYGPRIPIRLTSVGRAVVDIADSFHAAGINQTRHEIHLTVTAKISVILPGGANAAEIHTTVPIAQAVIVGEVPQSFTSVTGVSGTPQDNVLNMLN